MHSHSLCHGSPFAALLAIAIGLSVSSVYPGQTASAQDQKIYTTCGQGATEQPYFCALDAQNLSISGISTDPISGFISVSRDGNHLAFVKESTVYISTVDASATTVAGTIPDGFFYGNPIALSKDGTKLAIKGGSGLIVMDVSSGSVTPINTENLTETRFLEWSPDGDKLIYGRRLTQNNFAVFMRNADGSGNEIQLTTPGQNEQDISADWSLDGEKIIVHRTDSGVAPTFVPKSYLVHVDIASGMSTVYDITVYLDRWVQGIEISPDGQRIAISIDHAILDEDSNWIATEETISTMASSGGPLTKLYSYVWSGGPYTQPSIWETLEWTGIPEELIVNNTGDEPDILLDGVCDANASQAGRQCTLRAAIMEANSLSGRDSVSFGITNSGPHTITLSSALPEITGPLVVDATTQSGYSGKPVVSIVGSGVGTGLSFSGGNSTVRGVSIGGFTETAVVFKTEGGNRIESSHLGLNAAGTAAVANGVGLAILNSPNNVVGGTTAARKNLIGGNTQNGIVVGGTGSSGNRIIGNWIGLDATGEVLMSNGASAIGVTGDAENIVIGELGSGNSIASDGHEGIAIKQDSGVPTAAKVVANTIGYNASGSKALGSATFGVSVAGANLAGGVPDVQVGGESSAEGNLIDATFGVSIAGEGSTGAKVSNNKIGLLNDGTLAQSDTSGIGILVLRAHGSVVADNVVGGQAFGVILAANSTQTIGNKIGVDPTGELPRPNFFGISVPRTVTTTEGTAEVGSSNIIGVEGQGNTISGNALPAIVVGEVLNLTGSSSSSEETASNFTAESIRLGLLLSSHLGHSQESDRTLVQDESNTSTGQRISGEASSDGNVIAFNHVGTNTDGDKEVGNARSDSFEEVTGSVRILAGSNNVIRGNLISGNGAGVQVQPNDDSIEVVGTKIVGNVIGGSTAVGQNMPNQYGGIQIIDASRTDVVPGALTTSGPEVRNKIFGSQNWGINISRAEFTVIRQTDITGVDGPAINDFFRFNVHDSPASLEAVANSGSLAIELVPEVTGPIDLFVSSTCVEGNGHGTFVKTFGGTANVAQTETIGYSDLPGTGASGAIGLWLSTTSTSAGSDAETSVYSECVRIADPADVAKVDIQSEETGSVADTLDVTVDVTTNSSAVQSVAQTIRPSSRTQAPSTSARAWRANLLSDASPLQVNESAESIIISSRKQRPADGQSNVDLKLSSFADPGIAQQTGQTSQSAGTLYISRFPREPIASELEGSATAPSGSTVEPNTVSIHRYWTLRSNDLTGITYTACLDFDGIGGVEDASQLLVAQREHPGEPWTPAATSLSGTVLCAEGFTSFGDFAIVADSLVNPFHIQVGTEDTSPVDPTTRVSVSEGYPNPFGNSVQLDLTLAETGIVKIDAFDALGRRIESIHGGSLPLGRHSIRLDGARLPAGIYFIRIVASGEVHTRAVTLVR